MNWTAFSISCISISTLKNVIVPVESLLLIQDLRWPELQWVCNWTANWVGGLMLLVLITVNDLWVLSYVNDSWYWSAGSGTLLCPHQGFSAPLWLEWSLSSCPRAMDRAEQRYKGALSRDPWIHSPAPQQGTSTLGSWGTSSPGLNSCPVGQPVLWGLFHRCRVHSEQPPLSFHGQEQKQFLPKLCTHLWYILTSLVFPTIKNSLLPFALWLFIFSSPLY